MRNILILVTMLFLSISADGLTIVAKADGNWEDSAVWLGGNVPSASFNDTVIINTCVFINEDIFIQDQGLLIIGDSGKVCGHHNMHLEPGSEFDLYSRIYLDSLFVQGYF